MGYAHIDNLYKNQDVLAFKRVFVLEKIHGSSAHLSFRVNCRLNTNGDDVLTVCEITYFAGGGKHETFVKLFDEQKLKDAYATIGMVEFTVYGESYGGKQQGMRETYGEAGKFIAFDILTTNAEGREIWLNVPAAAEVVKNLGLEFVHYEGGAVGFGLARSEARSAFCASAAKRLRRQRRRGDCNSSAI